MDIIKKDIAMPLEVYVCAVVDVWPCGPTDKASDYGSGDSRFKSWQGRSVYLLFFFFFSSTPIAISIPLIKQI